MSQRDGLWEKDDDGDWEGGHVFCWPTWDWLELDNPKEFPPAECPYAAEHVVLREAK